MGSDDLVGRTVDGRYAVRAHIADGGMGSVYAALDTRLDRVVAFKVMRPDLARDPDFVTRFRREARAAASLSHPHVVAVHDQGEDDGLVFLAMEFVDGQTLRDLLEDKGALTPREALAVTTAVLEALRAAHRRGIVHRDIKPENVLISGDEEVKVADFGLARAVGASTATGLTAPLLGTVAYLAPEQVEHGTADHRTDLYSTGLLLHEMLTGLPAARGHSPIHIAWQHVNGTLPAPSEQVEGLPEELDELVRRATCIRPEDRFEDASAFLAAVEATRSALADGVLDRRPPRPAPDEAPGDDEVTPGRPAADHRDVGDGNEADPTPSEERRAPRRRHDTSSLHRATRSLPELGGATAATAPATPTRPTRRRFPLLAVLLSALLLAAGAAAYWWFGPPGERTVPEVVGRDRVAAESAIREADLLPVTEDVFSETVPRDRVISAGEHSGAVVRRGTRVPLVVSKGPERYDVPDVSGRTPAEATALIRQRHLQVAPATREEFDEKVPAGKVAATEPAAGTTSRPGTAVTLVVSKGREPVQVDDIPGMNVERARARLEDAGLVVQVAAERRFSSTVREGAVLEVSPSDGLYRGDTVTLTVSKGPEMVLIPDVRGKSAEAAIADLEAAGFTVRLNKIAGGIFGTAHSTSPARGSAPKGSVITLNVV